MDQGLLDRKETECWPMEKFLHTLWCNGVMLPSWCNVSSGIPQGSVLGPVLFVIFVNVLPDDIDSTVKIYADDTKIYTIQASALSDHTTMQADLEALKNWSQKWQLRFNDQKCSHASWKSS